MLSLVFSLSLALAGEPVDLGGPARAFALPTLNSSDPRLVSLYDHAGLGASDPHKAVVVHFFRAKAGFRDGTPDDLPPERRARYDDSGRRSRVLVKPLEVQSASAP